MEKSCCRSSSLKRPHRQVKEKRIPCTSIRLDSDPESGNDRLVRVKLKYQQPAPKSGPLCLYYLSTKPSKGTDAATLVGDVSLPAVWRIVNFRLATISVAHPCPTTNRAEECRQRFTSTIMRKLHVVYDFQLPSIKDNSFRETPQRRVVFDQHTKFLKEQNPYLRIADEQFHIRATLRQEFFGNADDPTQSVNCERATQLQRSSDLPGQKTGENL